MGKDYTRNYQEANKRFQNEIEQVNNNYKQSSNNEWYFRIQTIESMASVGLGCFMIPFIVFVFIFMFFFMTYRKAIYSTIFIVASVVYLIISMLVISPLITKHHIEKHNFYQEHKKDGYLQKLILLAKYRFELAFYQSKYDVFQELNKSCHYNIKILNELGEKYNIESKQNNSSNVEDIEKKIKEKEEELFEQGKRIELINIISKYHYQNLMQHIFAGFIIGIFFMMFSIIPFLGTDTGTGNPNDVIYRLIFGYVFFPLCTLIYYFIQYKLDKKVFDTYNQTLKTPIVKEKKKDYYSMFELENGIKKDICEEIIVLYKKLYNL